MNRPSIKSKKKCAPKENFFFFSKICLEAKNFNIFPPPFFKILSFRRNKKQKKSLNKTMQFPSFNEGRKKLTLKKKQSRQALPIKSPEIFGITIFKRENMRMRGEKGKEYPIIINNSFLIKQTNKERRAFSEVPTNMIKSNNGERRIIEKNSKPLSIFGSRLEEKIDETLKHKKEDKQRKETFYSVNKQSVINLEPIRKGQSVDSKKRRNTHKKSVISVSPWQGETEETNRDFIF